MPLLSPVTSVPCCHLWLPFLLQCVLGIAAVSPPVDCVLSQPDDIAACVCNQYNDYLVDDDGDCLQNTSSYIITAPSNGGTACPPLFATFPCGMLASVCARVFEAASVKFCSHMLAVGDYLPQIAIGVSVVLTMPNLNFTLFRSWDFSVNFQDAALAALDTYAVDASIAGFDVYPAYNDTLGSLVALIIVSNDTDLVSRLCNYVSLSVRLCLSFLSRCLPLHVSPTPTPLVLPLLLLLPLFVPLCACLFLF